METKFRFLFLLMVSINAFSQSNTSTYSPYSLFGLGKFNEANTGVTNSLGKSGVAITSEYELNGLNPASLGSIGRSSFFFDIGAKAEYNLYGDRSDSEKRKTLFNFSNVSFAFPLGKKSGVSVSLLPFTETGYYFQGIVTDIEGTNTNSLSTIEGSGGLNNINLNYGRKFNDKLSVGIAAKYFFGSIKQTEMVQLQTDLLQIQDVNYYKGFKIETGMQYKISPKTTIGTVVGFPSVLNGSRDRQVVKSVDEAQTVIENTTGISIDDYKIPFEFTMGIKYNYKNFNIVSDYKRTFWSSGMEDNIGRYTNSNIIGVGLEYFEKKEEGFRQKNRYRYRLGYNFDDGNLKVDGNKISNSVLTAGIGVPFGKSYNTYLNISYSYGTKGVVSNTLIRENYHSITLNLSFEDIWFRKILFD